MGEEPGKEQPGLAHAGIKLAGQITTTLGPQLTMLVILNVLVLGGLGWFVNARAQHTAAILASTTRLLTDCLERTR